MSELTIDDLREALSRLGEADAYQRVREPVIMHPSLYALLVAEAEPDHEPVRLPAPRPRHAVVTGLALLGVTL